MTVPVSAGGELVHWLDSAQDSPALGGKARLLVRRAAAGLPVPVDVLVAHDCGVLSASVLPVVAAVVLDASNPHEHATRVCREFGIPGVVQTRTATTVLREGQRVTVDGARGWVLDA